MKVRRRKRRADGGVFECRTCYKQFPSFQALGGHCTSHKRLPAGGAERAGGWKLRPVVHKCGVCGMEFPLGQALGGHMRRHSKSPSSAMALPGDLYAHEGLKLDAVDRSDQKNSLHGVVLELFV